MRTAEGILTHRVDGPAVGGAGETVVLLNGGFMTAAVWEPVAAPLAERLRVVRCDFRGQLATPGPPRRDLTADAADVIALLEHLEAPAGAEGGGEPTPVHLLGTSFGGLVGLLLAARRPRRVASLVAVTVTDHATPAMRAGSRRLRRVIAGILAGDDPGRFHDLLVREAYSEAHRRDNAERLAARREQIGSLPAAWFRAADGILEAVEEADLRPELERIRCPTLVVVAGEDRMTPPERGRAVAAAIPGAEVVEHPTSGHALVAEHPRWLAERAAAHIDAVAGRRGEGA